MNDKIIISTNLKTLEMIIFQRNCNRKPPPVPPPLYAGYGDMAVSNALGSNVFDIFMCLGIPWAMSCVVIDREPITIYSGGLYTTKAPMVVGVYIVQCTVYSLHCTLYSVQCILVL